MTGARLIEFWKMTAKLVKLADIGAANASGVKSHLINTSAQFGLHTGGTDLYDDLVTVVVPLQERVRPVADSLDRVTALVKASVESYLRSITVELAQPATAPVTTIMSALAANMQAVGGSIAPSGGRLWMFFKDNWGFSGFPTSGSPTYPETWVTTNIV